MFHNQFCHVVHSKAQFYLKRDISTSFYARYINLKLSDNPRHNIQSWHPPFPPLIERPFQARHLCAPDARGVTGRPGRPLPYICESGAECGRVRNSQGTILWPWYTFWCFGKPNWTIGLAAKMILGNKTRTSKNGNLGNRLNQSKMDKNRWKWIKMDGPKWLK